MTERIKFHQAFFGEKKKGHKLLGTSIRDDSLISHLTSRSDRPTSLDHFQPFVVGEVFQDYYYFLKITLDSTASRSGMVFSQAIIFKIEDAIRLTNIKELFSYFCEKQDFSIDGISEKEVEAYAPFQSNATYNPIISHLAEGKVPCVWVGFEGFDEVVMYLWNALPRELKSSFQFRYLDTPSKSAGIKNFSLILTQESKGSAWEKYSRFSLSSLSSAPLKAPVEKWLGGVDDSESRDFQQFISKIEISSLAIRHIPQIGRLYTNFRAIENRIADTKTIIAATRSISQLSPNPNKNASLKDAILDSLLAYFPSASLQEILSTRNIIIEAFSDGLVKMKQALQSWGSNFFRNITPHDFRELIEHTFVSESLDWWKEVVVESIREEFRKPSSSRLGYLFLAWMKIPELIPHSFFLISHLQPADVDTYISEGLLFPLNKKEAKGIISVTEDHKWLKTHALLAASIYTPLEAIEKHLNLLESKIDETGLAELAKHLDGESFFEAAFQITDERIIRRAAISNAENLKVWISLDLNGPIWRRLLYVVIENDSGFLDRLGSGQEITFELLDRYLAGQPFEKLLTVISHTHHSNIYSYPKRAKVWTLLPPSAKTAYLNSTARYAAFLLDQEKLNLKELEKPLLEALLSPKIITEVGKNLSYSLSTKILLIQSMSPISEEFLWSFIQTYQSKFSREQSSTIGKFIASRRLISVARKAYKAKASSHSLKEIVKQSKNILPFHETFLSDFLGISDFSHYQPTKFSSHKGFISRWRNLVSEGRLSEAINESLKALDTLSQQKGTLDIDKVRDAITVISADMKQRKSSKIIGDESHDTLNQWGNKTTRRFLDLLSSI